MRNVGLSLALLSSVFADGFFYSAHAQCAPTDKIYIDPRLVPKRPILSPGGFRACMYDDNPRAAASCEYLIQQYMSTHRLNDTYSSRIYYTCDLTGVRRSSLRPALFPPLSR